MICLPSIQIFRADEADDGVDQQRLERAGDGVGAGLDGLLVDAVMGVGGQRGALAGLEIHDVVADRAALQRQRGVLGLAQDAEIDAEAGVGGLGAGDGLEHQIDRRAAADHLDRVGDVGQHAGLGRDVVPQAQRVQHVQQGDAVGDVVGGRVDADHRVAAAQQQAVDRGRADAAQVVGGWLGCSREPSRPGRPRVLRNAVVTRQRLATLIRSWLRISLETAAAISGVMRRGERGQPFRRRVVGQQPVAEAADGQVGDRREGRGVVACRRSAA